MEKRVLIAKGGLNQDVAESFLPEGDYVDAKNIIIESGRSSGDGGTIRKIEGVENAQTSFDDYTEIDGTLTALDSDFNTTTASGDAQTFKIDDGNVISLWSDSGINAQLFTVNTTTGVVAANGSALNFGSVSFLSLRAVLLDSTHLLIIYRPAGGASNNFLQIIEFNTGTGSVSLDGSSYGFGSNTDASPLDVDIVDSDHVAIVYRDSSDLICDVVSYDTSTGSLAQVGSSSTLVSTIGARTINIKFLGNSLAGVFYGDVSNNVFVIPVNINVSTGDSTVLSTALQIEGDPIIEGVLLTTGNRGIFFGEEDSVNGLPIIQSFGFDVNQETVFPIGSFTSMAGDNSSPVVSLIDNTTAVAFYEDGIDVFYVLFSIQNINGNITQIAAPTDTGFAIADLRSLITLGDLDVLFTRGQGSTSIKRVFSVDGTTVSAVAGTVKAATSDNDGTVYYLTADGAMGRVYRVAVDGTVTELLNYTHEVTNDFDPDIRIIGDVLIWNYHEEGSPLSWYVPRSDSGTVSGVPEKDLLLINEQPLAPSFTETCAGFNSASIYEAQKVWKVAGTPSNKAELTNIDGTLSFTAGSEAFTFVNVTGDVSLETTSSVSITLTITLESLFGSDSITNTYSATSGTITTSLTDPTPGLYKLSISGTDDLESISVTGSGFSESPSDVFRDGSYQFAARYVFDSGETSALSAYSNTILANDKLSGAYVGVKVDSIPTYAAGIEVYARRNESPTWFRCSTISFDSSNVYNDRVYFFFNGQTFEALDDIESSKIFDSVPISCGSLEVIDNRVFLANNQDDLSNDNVAPINLSLDPSPTSQLDELGVNGGFNNYLGVADGSTNYNTFPKPRGAFNGLEFPFANDSVYEIGYALFDRFGRTRGIENSIEFKTGMFNYPVYPILDLSATGAFPSWAEYYEIYISRNKTKDFSYEGYASFFYWITEDPEGNVELKTGFSGIDKSIIKYFAVNISSMIESGFPYAFNAGDIMNINLSVESKTTYDETDVHSLRVLGVSGSDILCEWKSDLTSLRYINGGTATDNRAKFFFEIFSPANTPNENVIFYSTGARGTVADIQSADQTFDPFYFTSASDADALTDEDDTSTTIRGDMCWRTASLEGFTTDPISAGSWATGTYGDERPYMFRAMNKGKGRANWDRDIGKPLLRYEAFEPIRQESKIRFGGRYIQGTRINTISSFSSLDQQEVPYENGPINALVRTSKLQQEGSILLAISERETASVYVNEVVVRDSGEGDAFTAASDQVIGTVRTLRGGYGTTDKKSVFGYQGVAYFWDSNKRKYIRYSRNGLTPISDIGMKSYMYARTESPVSYYNPVYDLIVVDFGTDKALGYSEKLDRWVSFYNGAVELGVVSNDNNIYFTGTSLFKNSDTNYDTYVNGASSEANIEFVLNSDFPVKLDNIALINVSSEFIDFATSNNIKLGVFQIDIENERGQQSVLRDNNFIMEEYMMYAHVLRDSTSTGGLISGKYVIGTTNKIKFVLKDINDNTDNYSLNGIVVGFTRTAGHNL